MRMGLSLSSAIMTWASFSTAPLATVKQPKFGASPPEEEQNLCIRI